MFSCFNISYHSEEKAQSFPEIAAFYNKQERKWISWKDDDWKWLFIYFLKYGLLRAEQIFIYSNHLLSVVCLKHNRAAIMLETTLLLQQILISRDHPAKIKGQIKHKVNASGQVLLLFCMCNMWKVQPSQPSVLSRLSARQTGPDSARLSPSRHAGGHNHKQSDVLTGRKKTHPLSHSQLKNTI